MGEPMMLYYRREYHGSVLECGRLCRFCESLTRSREGAKKGKSDTDFHGLFFQFSNRVSLSPISAFVSFVLFVVEISHYVAGCLFQGGAENCTPGCSANAEPWLGGEASILIFGKLHRKISKLCQKEFARRHGCECEQLAE